MTSPLELLPNTYRAFFSGFAALTAAQKELIQPILRGQDIVLQAGTGAGKTEAVLAPATERLLTHPAYFTLIYIVPTRALALDMNRRIKRIYEKLGLKSGIRTGDGKHFRDAAPHLLITTPESLDVLLGSSNRDNKHFLKHVHLLLIDEVHVFLREERGHHLAHLRRRLALQSSARLQTAALSATLDEPAEIVRFFSLDPQAFCYKQGSSRTLRPCWVHIEDEERELPPFFDDLYRRFGCQKLLVFANSRKKCESLYDLLNREGAFSKNIFLHYSNLSTQERKFIERSFREKKRGVCISTSTLELGIDIGDVEGVVLMGPPSSTMAFLQRIGRSNRRQAQIKFWGVCHGPRAGLQLVRFLALFELAKDNQVEKHLPSESYSVLFQQILSCLYAKQVLSEEALGLLFRGSSKELPQILKHMLARHWLKPSKQQELYEGGWRYFNSLKKRQIWSNLPQADEEYQVILEGEKIAVLPLSTVRQLEVGDLIQLTGKVLKVLQIEEKRAALEVWVEESRDPPDKELTWEGWGPPIPFEVAQKMRALLLEEGMPEGLLNRTRRLLEGERELRAAAFEQPNGIRVYELGEGGYRYETFLGSVANSILCRLAKAQLSSKIEGLSISCDELGLESNEWLPFDLLEIPQAEESFQGWVSRNISFLKGSFSWNSWLHELPEGEQQKEIASRLWDPRVSRVFQRYRLEAAWLPLPDLAGGEERGALPSLPLKGNPWSLEQEKEAWGELDFPGLPLEEESNFLNATQLQGYAAQHLCPRWARFEQLGYRVEPHPRFQEEERELLSRRQKGIAFKNEVLEALQKKEPLCFETAEFSWQRAVERVLEEKKPLLLAGARLRVDGALSGNPDLIYLQHRESHLCLEVWQITSSRSVSYAQKWRVAFYAHLLESLLDDGKTGALPLKLSPLGGIVHAHEDSARLFEKSPFALAPYLAWMPRLLAQWKADSRRSSAVEDYSMEPSCTSCRYFSYCYQETLSQAPATLEPPKILSRGIESNDFPQNSQHWYFIRCSLEEVRWQCWENGGIFREHALHLQDYPDEGLLRKEAALRLHREWLQSVHRGKNPHLLVYELKEWPRVQKMLQSTGVKSLGASHVCWTSVERVLNTHFIWPIHGRLTARQVGACLGIAPCEAPPLSLYHEEPPLESSWDLYREIWSWVLVQVKSRRRVSFEMAPPRAVPLIQDYLAWHDREVECRRHEIVEFQKKPLSERVEAFRAIGPLKFLGRAADRKGCSFSLDAGAAMAKFRVGDFLKLAPVGSRCIQEGVSVVLDSYLPEKGLLSVSPLSSRAGFSRSRFYALDEEAADWNAPRVSRALNRLKDPAFRPEVIQMLLGRAKCSVSDGVDWIEQWYPARAQAAGLNLLQWDALRLPFREQVGLIEGPPGTGKTHLLVWTLMALVARAQAEKRPIKILVTAQTHRAIDQILKKAAKTIPLAGISPIPLWKQGRFDDPQFSELGIGQMRQPELLHPPRSLILGATGFGVDQLLEGKKCSPLFDWVVVDESSQLLAPHVLLSLIFGKGGALFYGDTQQLPPIVKGNYENASSAPRSILQELISRYGVQNRVRLNETYRLNADICRFASEQWYDGELRSVVAASEQHVELSGYPRFGDSLDESLDPSRSIAVVEIAHRGSEHFSLDEASWIAKAVKRLMEEYFMLPEQMGIISPHRLQNHAILAALKGALPFSSNLPRVDTVERMQGSEFDLVIFSATVSHPEAVHSSFLKAYQRFNVALTRARKKFIFVASPLFFQAFPRTERELIAQMPFEALCTFAGRISVGREAPL